MKDMDRTIFAKAMNFLIKLKENPELPGLHVEPLRTAVSKKHVRTGRVDDGWRAVLIRLDGETDAHFICHGIWTHDTANQKAERLQVGLTPTFHLPAIYEQPDAPADAPQDSCFLAQLGYSVDSLADQFDIPADIGALAMAAPDADGLLEVAAGLGQTWLADVLFMLAAGEPTAFILEELRARHPAPPADPAADLTQDERLVQAVRSGAGAARFAVLGGPAEFSEVLRSGDFAAWQVFLHPDQARLVAADYAGPFRLSGAAGTGKTVVLLHRARRLAQANPAAQVVLTTFTRNLADALRQNLRELDPTVPLVALGEPGVCVIGVDQLVYAVLDRAGETADDVAERVLGRRTWRDPYDADAAAAVAAALVEDDALAADGLIDHLLVDEAQDLSPDRWRLLRRLVPPGENDLFIAEDAHQRIYGPKLRLKDCGVHVVGRSRRLSLNYRTTQQNLGFALRAVAGGDYRDMELDAVVDNAGYRSARVGPDPEMITVTGGADQFAAAAERVAAWLAHGVTPHSIGVLAWTNEAVDAVAEALGAAGLPVTRVAADTPELGKVQVMTAHRAKGLEFANVIVVGRGGWPGEYLTAAPDGSARPTDKDLRLRSLAYVALTRARDELVVILD
jgi:hypothetical protein